MAATALEIVDCPVCAAKGHSPWAVENGYTAVQCDECQTIFVNPRPNEDAISEATKIGVHDGGLNIRARRIPAKVEHYRRLISEFYADRIAAGKPVRWLDVGAGYGEFVEAAIKALPKGSDVTGIEPMQTKVEVARQRGLNISDRSLSDVGSGYDVISLINVYSHIPDFNSFATMLIAKLAPGGSLFIETGNGAELEKADEFGDRLWLPDHLVFAGEAQLRRVSSDLGLTVDKIGRYRIDSPLWCLKMTVKSILRKRPAVILPGQSKFRTLVMRASLPQ